MKITHYNKRERNLITKRLDKWFNAATDKEVKDGFNWYWEFHLKMSEIAKDVRAENFEPSVYQVSAVFAALSPNNRVDRNLIDAVTVLEAVRDGIRPENVKVCTFNSNKFKAFLFAESHEQIIKERLIKSPKVNAFVENVGNLNSDFVTIDVWISRAIGINPSYLTAKRYNFIQSIILERAKELGMHGYQYQAIVWESIRNKLKQNV